MRKKERSSGAGDTTRRAEGRRTGRSSTVVSSAAPTRRRVLLRRSSPSAGTSAPRFADAPASAPRARVTLLPETPLSFPTVAFPNSSPAARAAAPRAAAARAPSRAPPRHPVPPIPLVTTPIAPPTPRRSAGQRPRHEIKSRARTCVRGVRKPKSEGKRGADTNRKTSKYLAPRPPRV